MISPSVTVRSQLLRRDSRLPLLAPRPFPNFFALAASRRRGPARVYQQGRLDDGFESRREVIEYDSDLEEETPEVKDTCQLMLEILPEVFDDDEEGAQYVLHHHGLNACNILGNPETFEITGVLDWEMTCAVPEWRAAIGPKFLNYSVVDWEEGEDEPLRLHPGTRRENINMPLKSTISGSSSYSENTSMLH